MAHGTRLHRRNIYRLRRTRPALHRVGRGALRRALAALEALYRR
jgi:hypothetical protein